MNSHIVILAFHRSKKKHRLLVLEKNPWCPRQAAEAERAIKLYEMSTSDFTLPQIPIEHLKSVNLLSKEDKKDIPTEVVGGALIF